MMEHPSSSSSSNPHRRRSVRDPERTVIGYHEQNRRASLSRLDYGPSASSSSLLVTPAEEDEARLSGMLLQRRRTSVTRTPSALPLFSPAGLPSMDQALLAIGHFVQSNYETNEKKWIGVQIPALQPTWAVALQEQLNLLQMVYEYQNDKFTIQTGTGLVPLHQKQQFEQVWLETMMTHLIVPSTNDHNNNHHHGHDNDDNDPALRLALQESAAAAAAAARQQQQSTQRHAQDEADHALELALQLSAAEQESSQQQQHHERDMQTQVDRALEYALQMSAKEQPPPPASSRGHSDMEDHSSSSIDLEHALARIKEQQYPSPSPPQRRLSTQEELDAELALRVAEEGSGVFDQDLLEDIHSDEEDNDNPPRREFTYGGTEYETSGGNVEPANDNDDDEEPLDLEESHHDAFDFIAAAAAQEQAEQAERQEQEQQHHHHPQLHRMEPLEFQQELDAELAMRVAREGSACLHSDGLSQELSDQDLALRVARDGSWILQEPAQQQQERQSLRQPRAGSLLNSSIPEQAPPSSSTTKSTSYNNHGNSTSNNHTPLDQESALSICLAELLEEVDNIEAAEEAAARGVCRIVTCQSCAERLQTPLVYENVYCPACGYIHESI